MKNESDKIHVVITEMFASCSIIHLFRINPYTKSSIIWAVFEYKKESPNIAAISAAGLSFMVFGMGERRQQPCK